MRDKVRINDLKVLFICPADNWGTLERRVINDCNYLRDMGGSPMLYCIKGSQIDKESQKYSLPRQFYRGKKINKFIDFRFYLDMKELIAESDFDLIHCYSFDYIWTLCLVLRPIPQIPLCLTYNKFLTKNYDGMLSKWLLKRVDVVMTFSETLKEQILRYTSIPTKKVCIVGAGVDVKSREQSSQKDLKRLGTFISNRNQLQMVNEILYSVGPIKNYLESINKKVHFFIFNKRDQDFESEMVEINEKTAQLKIDSIVDFVEVDSINELFEKIDIYFSLSSDEPFDDIELMAVIQGLPIIVPRIASRSDLLNTFVGIGTTYKKNDSRELRNSVVEIIEDEKIYFDSLKDNKPGLIHKHGQQVYFEQVYKVYSHLYSQRARWVSLKLKSN